jgi:hypothetical protein
MKTLNLLLLLVGAWLVSCGHEKATEQRNQTTNDASVSNGKYVTVVHEGEKLRPGESMGDIKDNPNIAGTDLDAINKVPSREIQYLPAEEKVHLEEKNPPTKE